MISVRRVGLAVAALALTPLLGGCWSGQHASTVAQAVPAEGSADIGMIKVGHAVLVATDPTTGTETLSATITNTGSSDDVLSQIVVGDGKATTSLPSAGIGIPAGNSVSLSWNSGPVVGVYGLTAAMSSFVQLTFVMRDAGTGAVEALVVPATGYWANVVAAPTTKP